MMKHLDTNDAPTSATFDFARSSPVTLNAEITEVPRFDDADFHALFESSGEALVMIDAAGIVQNANGRGRELLRLKQPVPRHSGLEDLMPGLNPSQFKKFLKQKNFSKKLPGLDANLTNGFPVRITLRSILPGPRHLLLCLEDGTVIQRAEAKWRQSEAELSTVLDSMQAGVVLFDPSGHVRFSSARFGQLFGIEPWELRNIRSFEELATLLSPRFRNPQAFSIPWKSFSDGSGKPAHDELEIVRPSRRVIERFSRPVLDSKGCPYGWLEIYSDVTGARQGQSKMLQTEKMAALGQFVSGIAHELNNPLTAIMGYAQLLLGRGLSQLQFSEASKVYQEAERARRIVKNLLYFAREDRPERTRVILNEIVERTVALRSYELKNENIVVACDLAPELPRTMADPYQLQQVVLNLLMNAEQALLEERGQGNVRIRTHSFSQRGADRIVLEFSDDGPGIPPDIASRIFDPFFTTKPFGVGTGLGLSIVYGIVQQHGGEVAVDSLPGMGARFMVDLPVIPVPAEERAASLPPFADQPGTVSVGRILVVEDEPAVAQLIVDILGEEGHQVEATLDSQEGLTRVSRSHYDLVICDLRMPRLDGVAFYDALVRAGSPMRHQMLFITGDMVAPRTLAFLEPNALPYLAKPFLVEELKIAVNRLLARGPVHESLATGGSIQKAGEA
jgi:signal transduction histidine kinase/CheY-like chemotaxis protein